MNTIEDSRPSDDGPETYPLKFTVDYPDQPLNRLTTFFRFLWIIPIGLVVAALVGGTIDGGSSLSHEAERTGLYISFGGVGVLFIPVLLMLVFRGKYPRWWFDWNLNLARLLSRVGAYALLLRDEYPSTDDEQSVHLEFDYPDVQRLSRVLPLFKWFLAIPHYFLLIFLWIGVWVSVVIAWFAILFTGRYPRGLFDYVVDVMAWTLRVEAYAFLLITDEYPPFSLSHP